MEEEYIQLSKDNISQIFGGNYYHRITKIGVLKYVRNKTGQVFTGSVLNDIEITEGFVECHLEENCKKNRVVQKMP